MPTQLPRPIAARYERGLRRQSEARSIRSGYPILEPSGHFMRSMQDFRRIPLGRLRNLANTLPVQRCIRRVCSTILAMAWSINPPKEDAKKDSAIELAKAIKMAIRRPNREMSHSTYGCLTESMVSDVYTQSFAAIERQEGSKDTQPFWLWTTNSAGIHVNPEWNPTIEGVVPKFFDLLGGDRKPIFSKNLFLVYGFSNSYELTSPSVVELAYNMIEAWLGISKFQFTTTTNAIREYMLILEEVHSQEELDLFREYWRTEVEGEGRIPILNGKVNVTKLGARNDEELYLKYNEYLLRMIALAFGMNARDMNITEHDNRATAGVAADSSFQDASLPMAFKWQEYLNNEVVGYYYPGFEFEFADTEPRNQDTEANTAKTLFDGKIISKNEARQRVGEEKLEVGGDIFSDGSKVGEEPAPPAPPPAPGEQPPAPGEQTPKKGELGDKKNGKLDPKALEKGGGKKKAEEEKQQIAASSSALHRQLSLF